MVFFKNQLIEIYTPQISDEYDIYTDDYLTKYSLLTSLKVDLQNLNSKDETLEFGEVQKNTYKIYTDYKIPNNAIIKIPNTNKTYTIIGEIQNNNHFKQTTHNKILIQEEENLHKLDGE